MAGTILPDGFLGISNAVDRLTRAMWSGLPRPIPVQAIRRQEPRLRVRYGPWRDQAGCRLRAAAVSGELPVYVVGKAQAGSRKGTSSDISTPLKVATDVLSRLITSRGNLTDYPIRPSLKIAGGDEKLFAALAIGHLVLRANDFDSWLQQERVRGTWPSQGSKSGRRVGRPTKQTSVVRRAVIALAHHKKWRGRDGIAKLHRLLVDTGQMDVPSQDTLARLVTRMHREIGDPALSRKVRARRKSR